MSLDNRTKRQIDDVVNLIDNKIDNKIQDAKDSISVEMQKDRFKGGVSNGLQKTLKANQEGIDGVLQGKYLSHTFDIKASDITTSSGSGSYMFEDYAGERSTLRSFFNLAQLFPQYPVNGHSVRFVTENSRDNQYGIVAEGSASTQSDVQFKEVKKNLETIRSHAVISEEVLQDGNLEPLIRSNFFQMLINTINNQLVNGTGDISSLNGNKVDCPTDASLIFADSVDNATIIDVIKAVIFQQQNSGFQSNLVLISPQQMGLLQFVKDSNNNYVDGGIQVIAPNHCRLGNTDIYSTEVLTGDKGFAVDTEKMGFLCTKGMFEAKISSEGKNALINNVAYLRMSARLNLAVLNANANMRFDISDVKSALETP